MKFLIKKLLAAVAISASISGTVAAMDHTGGHVSSTLNGANATGYALFSTQNKGFNHKVSHRIGKSHRKPRTLRQGRSIRHRIDYKYGNSIRHRLHKKHGISHRGRISFGYGKSLRKRGHIARGHSYGKHRQYKYGSRLRNHSIRHQRKLHRFNSSFNR